MTLPLYILTDARGFVTATVALYENLMIESSRLVLHAPITVDHWVWHSRKEWVKREQFTWPS